MTKVSISAVAMSVASLLDATQHLDDRGPRTHQARRFLAGWLDTGRGDLARVIRARNWLRRLASGR